MHRYKDIQCVAVFLIGKRVIGRVDIKKDSANDDSSALSYIKVYHSIIEPIVLQAFGDTMV